MIEIFYYYTGVLMETYRMVLEFLICNIKS